MIGLSLWAPAFASIEQAMDSEVYRRLYRLDGHRGQHRGASRELVLGESANILRLVGIAVVLGVFTP